MERYVTLGDKSMKMEVGRRYKVVYQIPAVHRYKRYFIGDYLGEERDFSGNLILIFSLRPVAGTSNMELAYIHNIFAVDKSTPCVYDQRYVPAI